MKPRLTLVLALTLAVSCLPALVAWAQGDPGDSAPVDCVGQCTGTIQCSGLNRVCCCTSGTTFIRTCLEPDSPYCRNGALNDHRC